MRCRHCGERWRLSKGIGNGGSPSPGEHLVISATLFLIAAGLAQWVDPLPAWICAWVGLLVLVMGLCGCGYREATGVNGGSCCGRCGTLNWIWPWSF